MIEERECKIHGLTDFSRRKDGSFRCKKCSVDAVTKRRRAIKLKAVEYKGGECYRCGYNICVDALEFHHRNPEEKDFNLGAKGHSRAWDRVKEELDKCDMVCSNCHKEIHYDIRNTGG